MAQKYILSLDQGTTSSRAILFDRDANIVQVSQREFTQIFPQPGWVEHNPNEIFDTQSHVAKDCLKHANAQGNELAAVGITSNPSILARSHISASRRANRSMSGTSNRA